ncbi:hypothetical protein kac65v162_gp107 [Nodularia phage vB_NspS-kac65v162]|jgi:hypothetical protein|nr:hypothetical protein HWA92_gp091 [Nodularia phage vB_NpeS-2AV2]YP_009844710.1 hypothetical protein HWC12_gp107 [Nodularia phage vB_NspS-kac65v151]YP_009844918.1 hypothetical protein HWC13_gp109 [Nodularia phage vB_NspS-kac68v161]QBQ73345.1 hypothetical protein kac65v161_gp107 [Nodularia phage vB_NspS-kac65v161]QBQ73551.1 hypothetical protein kac65v162_gp107 [Nodularia phage vB_NspS-kac65v162]ALY07543.1 hypothetical protein 2AV2_91 [Nodularia phage vB_NpeS-2AV2]QBQ73137.1 hypothetical prote
MKLNRLNIALSDSDLRWLTIWAWVSGRTPGAYASHIVSNRVSTNLKEIKGRLQDEADLKGISLKELIKEIVGEIDDPESKED